MRVHGQHDLEDLECGVELAGADCFLLVSCRGRGRESERRSSSIDRASERRLLFLFPSFSLSLSLISLPHRTSSRVQDPGQRPAEPACDAGGVLGRVCRRSIASSSSGVDLDDGRELPRVRPDLGLGVLLLLLLRGSSGGRRHGWRAKERARERARERRGEFSRRDLLSVVRRNEK